MGTIVACINSRCGVGKSTMAVHLAAWCHERGARTGLVEAEVRGSASGWLRAASPDIQTFRLLTPDEILDHVPDLAVQFDVLVLDGVSASPEMTRAMLLVTHLALILFGPSVADQRAVGEAIHSLHQARRIRSGPPQALLVPNQLRGRRRAPGDESEVSESSGVPVSRGLRHRRAYAEAAEQQTLVWRLGPRGTQASVEMIGLLERLGIPGPMGDTESAVEPDRGSRRRVGGRANKKGED